MFIDAIWVRNARKLRRENKTEPVKFVHWDYSVCELGQNDLYDGLKFQSVVP